MSVWITRQAVRIIRSTVNVLMEGTPEGVEFADVEAAISAPARVEGVHDLHIWSISSADLALSAHIRGTGGDSGRVRCACGGYQADAGAGLRDRPRDAGVGTGRGECAGSTCELPSAGLQQSGRQANGGHAGHRH